MADSQLLAKDLRIARLEADLAAIGLLHEQLQAVKTLLDGKAQEYEALIGISSRGHADGENAQLNSQGVDKAVSNDGKKEFNQQGSQHVLLSRLATNLFCCDSISYRVSGFLYGSSVPTCCMRLCRGSRLQRAAFLRVGDQLTLNRFMPSVPQWRSVQFSVPDCCNFFMLVQLMGVWTTSDSFRIGIATDRLPLEDADGHKHGLWLSPKSGHLLAEDGTDRLLAPFKNTYRNCLGVHRGKGNGKGRSSHSQSQRGSEEGGAGSIAINGCLESGSLWALEYRNGNLFFYFAQSLESHFQLIGQAENTKFHCSNDNLPSSVYPSLLCRCPGRDGAHRIIKNQMFRVDDQQFAYVKVLYAGSTSRTAVHSIVDRPVKELSWLQNQTINIKRICHELRRLGTNEFELRHLRWKQGEVWEAYQFDVADFSNFRVSLCVEGDWAPNDEFAIGLAPPDVTFHRGSVPAYQAKLSENIHWPVYGSSNKYYEGYSRHCRPLFPASSTDCPLEFERNIWYFNPLTGMCNAPSRRTSSRHSASRKNILFSSTLFDREGFEGAPGDSVSYHIRHFRNAVGKQHRALKPGGIWSLTYRNGVVTVSYGDAIVYEEQIGYKHWVPMLWIHRREVRNFRVGPSKGKGQGRGRPLAPRPDAVLVSCSSARLRVVDSSHVGGLDGLTEVLVSRLRSEDDQAEIIRHTKYTVAKLTAMHHNIDPVPRTQAQMRSPLHMFEGANFADGFEVILARPT